MKKNLILSFCLITAMAVSAETVRPPQTFFENFSAPLPSGEMLPSGWVSYGIGQPVATFFEPYFGSEGSAPYYRVANIEGVSAAWSCSTFKYAATADEWLVTPPIHITSDSEVLELTAVANGAYAANKYRVLISEAGQDKDSFRKTPLVNATLTGWETEVRSKSSYVALNGYAGKDICLAFVNKSQDTGMLGFTDIRIAPYTINITDNTPSVLPVGNKANISFTVNVRTPNPIEGITAVLTVNGKETQTLDVAQTIDINGGRVALQFDPVDVVEGGLDYSVTIAPKLAGATPAVVTGEIGVPTTSYPPVALIEEFTGTWCSNCPRGAAFMNYYHDKYDGKNGNLKAIGIALHSTNDPMLMEDESYINTAYAVSAAKGYPSAWFNRTKLGDPSDKHILEEMVGTRSNSRVFINRVDYNGNGPLNITYSVENSYSKKDMNQRVALVIVENDVKGDNWGYAQINGLYGATKQAVINTYGEELWPYFQLFVETPSPVPAAKMVYQHVARGIYPDYYGERLNDACQAEVANKYERQMDMPNQVMNAENIAVIAILVDAEHGNLLSACEVEAKHFNQELSGVAGVAADSSVITMEGTTLRVGSASEGNLRVYGIDGRLLRSARLNAGDNAIDLSGVSGMIIVSAVNAEGTVDNVKFIL